ncbi:MAG: hypothetical protein HQL09_01025 [Nitrospirae bacterium]|nr:hypothetical protein [Nitrospirota bacterium]
MIFTQDLDGLLRNLGREFFISDIFYVPSIISWAKKKNLTLSEPAQPMKLITENDRLIMMMQAEISDELLDGIINGLSVRWAVRDVAADVDKRLNSIEKRIAWYFLKEYARTKENLAGDELLEDQWAMTEIEKLGFFRK